MSKTDGSMALISARVDGGARQLSRRVRRRLGSLARSARPQPPSAPVGRDSSAHADRADQGRPRIPLAQSRLPETAHGIRRRIPRAAGGPRPLRPDLRRVPHPQAERPERFRRGVPARIPRANGRAGFDPRAQFVRTTSFHKKNHRRKLASVQPGDTIDDFDLLVELGGGAFAKVFSPGSARCSGSSPSRWRPTPAPSRKRWPSSITITSSACSTSGRSTTASCACSTWSTSPAARCRRWSSASGRPRRKAGSLLLQAIDKALTRRGNSRPSDRRCGFGRGPRPGPKPSAGWERRSPVALDYAAIGSTCCTRRQAGQHPRHSQGSPKLADFNVSYSGTVTGATPEAYFGGGLAYMSPEQLEACKPSGAPPGPGTRSTQRFVFAGNRAVGTVDGISAVPRRIGRGRWSATLDRMGERRRSALDTAELGELPGCPEGLPPLLETTLAFNHQPAPLVERPGDGPSPRSVHESQGVRAVVPAGRGPRVRLRKYAVLIVFVAAGLPNVLGGVFNYVHDSSRDRVEARADVAALRADAGGDQRRGLSGGGLSVLVSGLFGLPGAETVPGGAIGSGTRPPAGAAAA